MFLLLLATAACAASNDPDTKRLERVQVSATALPTTAASANQHITILGREQLDAMLGASVAEVLSRQAGLSVDRSPRSGGYGALYLRGADPSHVVILVDHVRQNDPLSSRGSAVDLNSLSCDDVERIEIVRGNASVVNADAMAGLVHIFTRRQQNRFAAYAGGERLRGAQAAFSSDQFWLSSGYREEGDQNQGFYETRSANAGWGQTFADTRLFDQVRVEASGRFADSDARGFPDDSGGERFAVLRELESRDGQNHQFAMRAEAETPWANWALQLATETRRSDETSPGVAPGVRDDFGLPAIQTHTNYRRDEMQLTYGRTLSEAWSVTAGALAQRERGQLDSLIDLGFMLLPAEFERNRHTASVFGEARWQAAAWTIQGGVRHEQLDDGDAITHPMLAVQQQLERGLRWGATIASSAKQPSFYALAHPLVGDPGLKVERAVHREVFIGNEVDTDPSRQSDAWSWRLTWFSARYRDLIDIDSGPPPRLVNRARIESDGLEWRVGKRWTDRWHSQFEGAWMQVEDPIGGVALRQRPELQWTISTQWQVSDRAELSATLHHVGKRFDSAIPTGDRWLSAGERLDLSWRHRLGPADVRLTLDNALGERFEEAIGNDIDGRRLWLSVQWGRP
ncbi:TonB-dependent receptor plug domain-containing protein [Ahniella affigens]|uniref:TonB-dependent receptor plug domain-containing protein n=1 Tax=Ahniella affigens TaxID=2021234 RepID=UPI0014754CAE|nr:TonB-dependent receptor [Ahniella affigens]